MRKILIFMFLNIVAVSVHASKLIIPQDFEFIAVDGADVKRSIMTHIDTLEMDEGKHKIALRYKDSVMDLDLGYDEVINSQPFIVMLLVEKSTVYQLEPEAEGYKDKRQFADNPSVIIKRQDGSIADFSIAMNQRKSQWASATGKETALQALANIPPAVISSGVVATPASNDTSKDPATMLKYWWEQSDKKTRQEFMGWVIGQ